MNELISKIAKTEGLNGEDEKLAKEVLNINLTLSKQILEEKLKNARILFSESNLTEERVSQLIQRSKFREIWSQVQVFKNRLPPPMSGGGLEGNVSWNSYTILRLDGIQAVSYVEGLTKEELKLQRYEAIDAILWNKATYPGSQSFREIAEYEMNRRILKDNLKGFEERGRKRVRIIGGNDACP